MRENIFSESELSVFDKYYSEFGPKYVAQIIGRSEVSTRCKASKLGIYYNPKIKYCSVEGCSGKYHAKGLCIFHYRKQFVAKNAQGKTCSAPNCSNLAKYGNGLCHSCYSNIWARRHFKDYYQKNKEKLKARQVAVYKNNREKILEQNRRYRKDNTEHVQEIEKIGLLRRLDEVLAMYGNRCGVCGEDYIPLLEWHHRLGGVRDKNYRKKKLVYRLYNERKTDHNIMLLCGNCHARMNLMDKTSRAGSAFTRIWLFGGQTSREKRVEEVLRIYEFRCGCCHASEPDILNFHHRKRIIPSRECQDSMVSRVLKSGTPLEEVLLLCRNCHTMFDILDETHPKKSIGFELIHYRKTGEVSPAQDGVALTNAFNFVLQRCQVCP